jgi:hypothetical protein
MIRFSSSPAARRPPPAARIEYAPCKNFLKLIVVTNVKVLSDYNDDSSFL